MEAESGMETGTLENWCGAQGGVRKPQPQAKDGLPLISINNVFLRHSNTRSRPYRSRPYRPQLLCTAMAKPSSWNCLKHGVRGQKHSLSISRNQQVGSPMLEETVF